MVGIEERDRLGLGRVDALDDDLGADTGSRLFVLGSVPAVRRECQALKREVLEGAGAPLGRDDLEPAGPLGVLEDDRGRAAAQNEPAPPFRAHFLSSPLLHASPPLFHAPASWRAGEQSTVEGRKKPPTEEIDGKTGLRGDAAAAQDPQSGELQAIRRRRDPRVEGRASARTEEDHAQRAVRIDGERAARDKYLSALSGSKRNADDDPVSVLRRAGSKKSKAGVRLLPVGLGGRGGQRDPRWEAREVRRSAPQEDERDTPLSPSPLELAH